MMNSNVGNSASFEAKFKVVNEVGSGGFGKVYLIKPREQGDSIEINGEINYLAMKVIKISRIAQSEKQVQYARNEMRILASISHPFIVKLFFAFHCSKRLYLVMEYMTGGDMRQLMNQKRILSETEAKFYSASIALALAHLHQNKIIYRDLKPENIMFDCEGKIKLVDLGLCKIFDANSDEKTSTICGTIEYLAPEIVSKKPYGIMVDWWSLGILIHDMLIGHQPFRSDNKKKLINKILSETPNIPNLVSKVSISVIKQLLFKNSDKRLRWVESRADGQENDKKSPFSIQHHQFYRKINWDSILNGEVSSPADLNELLGNEDRFTNYSQQPYKTIRWSRLSGPDHNRHEQNSKSGADDTPTGQVVSDNDVFKILEGFRYVSPNTSLV